MKQISPVSLLMPIALALASCALCASAVPRPQDPGRTRVAGLAAPLATAFVENDGQWGHGARFVARFGATTAFLEDTGLVLSQESPTTGEGVAVRLRFRQTDPVTPLGEQPLSGRYHFLRGNDPETWRRDVVRYGRVRWAAPWPGIDVVAYEKDGHLEYDLEFSPGSDSAAVEVAVEGAEELRLDDGALIVETAAGPLRQTPPVSWRVGEDGSRTPVEVRYELTGDGGFRFDTSGWDGAVPLVIDPGLLYATYLGGSGGDRIYGVHVEPSTGVLTVGGLTNSVDFPTTMGTYQSAPAGNLDFFVARLDPSLPPAQQLVAATFIGGTGRDSLPGDGGGTGIFTAMGANQRPLAVAPGGMVAIGGLSESVDYPVTGNAWNSSRSSFQDGVVTVLDPSLTSLVYSTYLGGNGNDIVSRLQLDASPLVTVGGQTRSTDFLSGGSVGGGDDAFVVQLDPNLAPAGQIVSSVRIAGNNDDRIHGLRSGPSGKIAFGGSTRSFNLATTANAWQPNPVGGCGGGNPALAFCRAFVGILDPSQPGAGQLAYLTYIDGPSFGEVAFTVHIDGADVLTVGGATAGGLPLTPNAFDTTSDWRDGMIARIDPSLPPANQMLYLSYFGGGGSHGLDQIFDIQVDSMGRIVMAGWTQSSVGFPTTPGTFDPTFNGTPGPSLDAFVAWLDPSLPPAQQLLYSTFYGGDYWEHAAGVAVDGTVATIVGSTNSVDLPMTASPWDPVFDGNIDSFIAQIDMRPIAPPVLTSMTPTSIPNWMPGTITLTGQNLQNTQSVTIGGMAVPSFNVSPTQIDFTLQRAVIGSGQPVVVTDDLSRQSNALSLNVTATSPPMLVANQFGVRGFPVQYTMVGDSTDTSLLLVSAASGQTVIPNIVTLDIGGGSLGSLLSAGFFPHNASGIAETSIAYPTFLPSGFMVHAQSITADPMNLTLPVTPTNAVTTTLF